MRRVVRKIPYIKNLEQRLKIEKETAELLSEKLQEKCRYEYAYNSLKKYTNSIEYRYTKHKRIFAIDIIGNVDVIVSIEWTEDFKTFKMSLETNNSRFDTLGELNFLIKDFKSELIDIVVVANERSKGYGTYLLKIFEEFLKVNFVTEVRGRLHIKNDETDKLRKKFYITNDYELVGNPLTVYKKI